MRIQPALLLVPVIAILLAGWAFANWFHDSRQVLPPERLPGQTGQVFATDGTAVGGASAVVKESLTTGPGQPSVLTGQWPQFRGPGRDGRAEFAGKLLRSWPPAGPKVLWRIPVGEGHAGPAIREGRVYLVDYDRDLARDAVRCLSLDDGREIWRYSYPVKVKRNHGMSRTVPAVNDKYVVTMGPKCHVHCLDARSGQLVWQMDLAAQFGTVVPAWYAGQCPLIDGDLAILAPGGQPLAMAVDLATGQIRWRTENPGDWGMTHSSIMPFEFGGRRQYVYCTTRGVVGLDAADGRLLWQWPNWKIGIANVPTPVVVDGERLLMTGGYGAGCVMLKLSASDDGGGGPAADSQWAGGPATGIAVAEQFRLKPKVFACEQQTPILYDGHLYSVLPDGRLACLDLDGKQLWATSAAVTFGLGPFTVVNDILYVLNDQSGELVMVQPGPDGYVELGRAKVLNGHDAWGPMAFADGRLILRDLTEMACIEVAE